MAAVSRNLTLSIICAFFALASGGAGASTPSSGTLTDISGPVSYSAGPFPLDNPTPIPEVDSGPECNNPQQPCDEFYLTVTLPAGYSATHPGMQIRFTQSWTDAGTGQSDYDLYVYPGTVTTLNGSQTAQSESNGSANPEVCFLPVADGTQTFTVISTPFVSTGEVIHVTIDLVQGPMGVGGAIGFGQATPTIPGAPRYQNFFPPAGSAADGSAGEFSIGFDPKSHNILTLSDLNTFRVTPPELRTPPLPFAGPALWVDVS